MYALSKQQADPRKWEGKVVEEVVQQRRELLPLDKLGMCKDGDRTIDKEPRSPMHV
jgi:hypothetical protein